MSNENKNWHKENIQFSERERDRILFVISGAGIYVCLEAIKFMHENVLTCGLNLIKASGIGFTLAVIALLTSHITAKQAGTYGYKSELNQETGLDEDLPYALKFKKISDTFNSLTSFLNKSAGVLIILSLVLTLTFFLITF
jgi:hypothetical protein